MKKANKITKQEFNFFNLYEEAIDSQKFISYEKFIASVLLESKLGFSSNEYLTFEKTFNEAINKKFDLLFEHFVLHFDVNLRFSSDALVPTIVSNESASVEAINLRSNADQKINLFLQNYNSLLYDLIRAGNYVEILPKIVIYVSENTRAIKILFDKSSVLYRGQ
ncbi:Protein of uncharacterised function (DUF2714) [Mycoplasmopsis californica]|uniref:DUF2714 domain-containing protein n=1 Tax=Mycoplasmopsis equigenitalium TaxID=114883 RepID=A0ABY5J193_9BACT|nr:DUF2714 domain-containing protein [Mycoplasmopsis equigenitalium]UUD37032.1 DUF2714 domain-containing protein [Mycoplasmopsis equigenitalium]VEU69668.1 Protein of uncharacterised function (DUF2714) [Mycoplasmopsis californica]